MTHAEAIAAIKANWPTENYTMLREALTLACAALASPPAEDADRAPSLGTVTFDHKAGTVSYAPRHAAQAPPASDPPGLVASLREQVRQWRDRASGIDDDNSYHFNSERHARANQMDECADEIEELLPASPQAKED